MKLRSVLFMNCYRLLTTFLVYPAACYLAIRRRHDPPYGRGFWQLFGYGLPRQSKRCVVFYAASMGEANSLKTLASAFATRHPGIRTVVSVMTTTGRQAALKISGVEVVFAPLDQICACRRFFRKLRPLIMVNVDTELWPEKLAAAARYDCPTVIVNARMQQKNLDKYLRHKDITKDLLASRLSMVLCSSQADAARYRALGVPSCKISVTGNIKYDISLDQDLFELGRNCKAYGGQVIGALSLHPGEEEPVVEAFLTIIKKIPNLRMVIVPRHLKDTEAIQSLLNKNNIAYQKRSTLKSMTEFTQGILIGDSMGEMPMYLGLCDLAFEGGSFVKIGGHNPIEPASCAIPVLTGPDYHNFKSEYDELIRSGGASVCYDAEDLANNALKLLLSKTELERCANAAISSVKSGRGAVERTLDTLDEILSHHRMEPESPR